MSAVTPAPDSDTPLVQPATLADVIAVLEEDVVFGRLHPRERLVEDELMERFCVKRHVVREALAALERMGLVERRKNVGAFVRAFSAQQVIELYEVRALLETEAARRIPHDLAPQRLARLKELQTLHDQATQAGDARAVFRYNAAFHQELFSLSRNQTLHQALTEFARQTHPIRFASLVSAEYREQARREHWRMIEALEAGDIDTLVALCAAHLLPSRDAYLKAQSYRD